MSTISSVSSALSSSASSSSSSTSSASELTQSDFLKLLTTQMQYQDPLNPVDDTQMVSQMAQFSELSAVENLSTKMDSMVSATNSGTELSASQLVGKQVSFQGTQTSLTSGSTSTFDVVLPQATNTTNVTITDSGGNVVRTLQLGAGAAGTTSLTWDGRSSSGGACPTGQYTLSVTGTTSSGTSVAGTTNVRATVTGVDLSSGSAMLLVAGQELSLSKICGVYQTTSGS